MLPVAADFPDPFIGCLPVIASVISTARDAHAESPVDRAQKAGQRIFRYAMAHSA